jgi:hypothetical protein
MVGITRVGPPKAVGEIPPDSYLWDVNLSGIVATGWIERFKTAGGGTSVARPAGVTFEPVASLSFVSSKDFVQEWMIAIDTWIDSTNATLSMEMDEVDKRARAEEAEGQVLHARLRAVSDEVKSL